MQQFRLIGLILFITTIFLGMAALATQTAAIRLFDARHARETPIDDGGLDGQEPDGAFQPQFIAIPIVWPLVIAGGAGLVMWFGTAPREPPMNRGRRRRRKR